MKHILLFCEVDKQLTKNCDFKTTEIKRKSSFIDCEQSLFGQSRLSSAGLEIAN